VDTLCPFNRLYVLSVIDQAIRWLEVSVQADRTALTTAKKKKTLILLGDADIQDHYVVIMIKVPNLWVMNFKKC